MTKELNNFTKDDLIQIAIAHNAKKDTTTDYNSSTDPEILKKNFIILESIKENMKFRAGEGYFSVCLTTKDFENDTQKTWIADKLKSEGYDVNFYHFFNIIEIAWR